jgi:hypothetical protein
MYRAPVAALTAELFGKNRWAIVGTTLIPPVAWFAGKAYLGKLPIAPVGSATPISLLILMGCALQFALIFAYVDLTAGSKMSGGFPKHILLLPAPTWLLALVPIVAGASFISGFVLLWLHYVSGVHFSWAQQLIIAAAIASLMCWLQAMSWELLPSRAMRIVLLTVVAIVAVLAVVSLLANESDNLFGRTWGAVGLSMTAVSGLGLAYLAVIRSRRGDTLDFYVRIRRFVVSSGLWPRSTHLPALANAVAAQNWYEWRVYGRVLPTCMIILAAGPLASIASSRVRHSPSFGLPALLLFLFFLIAPLVGGAYVSKNLTQRIQRGLFGATRPLSDIEIAFAKLRLTVRSYLMSFAMLFAVAVAFVLSSSNNEALASLWSRLTGWQGVTGAYLSLLLLLIVVTATSWAAGAYFMSLQLFAESVDRKKHGWKISLGVTALFFLLLDIGGRVYRARHSALAWLQSPHYELLIPAVLLIGIGLCLVPPFRRLGTLHVLDRLASGVGVVAAVCLIAVSQLNLAVGYQWALGWLVVAVALMTFIPYLLVPVLIGMSRHR